MSNPKSLTDEQVAQIRAWAESGDGLPDIQRKLREQMDLRVTYLETRFLLEDLKIELLPTPEPEPDKPADDEVLDDGDLGEGDGSEGPSGAGVKMTVDQVLRPGALLSGKADFGGGQVVAWWLDQMGRLGMDPSDPAFRPSEEQARSFQAELSRILRQSGF
jgi:hypothetical protein